MTLADVADQYFTYECRLTSFLTAQPLSKRRTSNANSKATKSLKWPHQFLSAEELAKAGFFFSPTQTNPDNVACFLCHKSLDGWEKDDDPLSEHLKHSSNCGWAIVATIDRQDGELSEENPASSRMIDARKATFANKWPHENKKGWKCKVKQMVDAGWKYTPTPECDDTATCTYCSLALDGWEPADKPLDEHHKRSPDCTFFALVNNHKQTSTARKSRAKKDRGSKASRYSTQSVFTAASEAPSLADLPPEEDDSVLTTTTNAEATPGEKKMGKGKRTTTGRGRKTKAKKSEAVEVDPTPRPEDDHDVKEVPVPKATRGRKRKSEQIQDSTALIVEIEAPAAKRRATRARGSTAIEDSHREESADQAATEDLPNSAEHTRTKRTARSSRKPSAAARIASLKVPVPTDEEIDAALQADLDMHVPHDEGMPATGPLRKATRSNKMMKADYAMFDTEPMDIDEAAIEAELEAMEADSKPLPKAKGTKGRPRKASAKQQAASKKAAAAESEAREAVDELASDQIAAELEHSISIQYSPPALKPKKQRLASRQVSRKVPPRGTSVSVQSVNDNSISQTDLQSSTVDQNDREDSGNDSDVSLASQSTIVRATTSTRGSTVKRTVGRPSKRVASRNIEEVVQKRQNAPGRDPGSIVDLSAAEKEASPEETSLTEERFYTPAPEFHEEVEERMSEVSEPKPIKPEGRLPKAAPALAPITAAQRTATGISDTAEEAAISAPAKSKVVNTDLVAPAVLSSTPPPREKEPSRSLQSSDAENQPPSSKPSTARKAATPKPNAIRIPLAAITPVISPSKLNIISSLRSDNPWTAVDLEAIFMKTPGDENVIGKGVFEDALGKMKTFELTSPEKRMTVEEWVLYNAEVAEERLRNECERMVGIFEREGTKAMRAVEGIDCAE